MVHWTFPIMCWISLTWLAQQSILVFLCRLKHRLRDLLQQAQNPSVDIIFHPTGRIINKRDGYPVNIPKIIETAKDTNTILEIDAHYRLIDLKDEYIKMAVEGDVKLVVDSDAHHPIHYAFLKLGIAQARRGWATKNDTIKYTLRTKFVG